MYKQHESFDFSTQLKDILKDMCTTVFAKKKMNTVNTNIFSQERINLSLFKKNFIKTDSTKKLYETDAIVFD